MTAKSYVSAVWQNSVIRLTAPENSHFRTQIKTM